MFPIRRISITEIEKKRFLGHIIFVKKVKTFFCSCPFFGVKKTLFSYNFPIINLFRHKNRLFSWRWLFPIRRNTTWLKPWFKKNGVGVLTRCIFLNSSAVCDNVDIIFGRANSTHSGSIFGLFFINCIIIWIGCFGTWSYPGLPKFDKKKHDLSLTFFAKKFLTIFLVKFGKQIRFLAEISGLIDIWPEEIRLVQFLTNISIFNIFRFRKKCLLKQEKKLPKFRLFVEISIFAQNLYLWPKFQFFVEKIGEILVNLFFSFFCEILIKNRKFRSQI